VIKCLQLTIINIGVWVHQCVWHWGYTHISGVHLKPWSGLTRAEQVECCLLLKNSAASARQRKLYQSIILLQRTNVALTCHTPPPFFASLCSDTVCWGSEINRAYFSTGQTLDTFTAIVLCNLSSTPRPYFFRFGMGTRFVRHVTSVIVSVHASTLEDGSNAKTISRHVSPVVNKSWWFGDM